MAGGLRRGRLVAVEAAAGAAVGGAAIGGAVGITAAAAGAAVAGVALARSRGRWLTDRLLDGAPTAVEAGPAPPAPGVPGGLAAALPGLHVVERADRAGAVVPVAGDGQGFAAALELDGTAPLRVRLGPLVAHAAADPSGLASVQVLVEQATPPSPRSWAGLAYRELPTAGVPALRRVLVVLRHEPVREPAAAERRGGGADGARAAVAAAVGRARLHLAGAGARVLDGPVDLARVLGDLGDPAPRGELRSDAWVAAGRSHTALAGPPDPVARWSQLLAVAAALPVERSVVSLWAELLPGGTAARLRCAVRVRCAVRLVGAEPSAAGAELVAAGLAAALPGSQAVGLAATLPLGGGRLPLRDAVGDRRR